MKIVNPKRIAIGVDIGGTKIKAGLVDTNGHIIGTPESIQTLAHEPGEIIIERLFHLIKRMIQQAEGVELTGIEHICPQTAERIQIKPAGLKENAGFMGAAALIFEE